MIPNMRNYEEECKTFRWNMPEYFNFGFDVIDKWAAENNKLALVSVDDAGETAQRHTFKDLALLSNQSANVLRSHGIKKGDRVMLMMRQIPEWYFAVLGCVKLGAVFIPTPSLLTAKDLEYRFGQSGAVAVIVDSNFTERFEAIKDRCPSLKKLILVDGERAGWVNFREEIAAAPTQFEHSGKTKSSDPLLIYFTSGTTGYQKMVLHTHDYALAHENTAKYYHDLKATDLQWTIADPGWAKAAWGKLFGQWDTGAAVLQQNRKGKFHPETTLKVLERFGVTVFCAPPTVYRMLVQEDLSRFHLKLRHSTSAAEPLSPETMRLWKQATGLDLYDGYGQSESVLLICNYRAVPIKPGSIGKPAPGVTMSILDEHGNELPPGVKGFVAVKVKPMHPPGLFKHYWDNRQVQPESFRGDWYYVGDIAYRDEDGYYWFIGRADDIIKSSGYRIGPFEVESALQAHPSVAESAAVGVPDPLRGEVVKAFIVLKPGYTGSPELVRELQEHVKHITAPYKYPRKIEFVTEIPKNENGKIVRRELRRWEGEKTTSSG